MSRRVPLPKITECMDCQEVKCSLSCMSFLKACYPFVVVGALCLAHVHLQFAKADMLMQEGQLQREHRALLRRLAVVERKSQDIDMEGLRNHGKRDLAMQEVENPTRELLAQIPLEIQRKYEKPLKADAEDVMVAQIREDRNRPVAGLKDTLLSLFETGRAMASVSVASRQ